MVSRLPSAGMSYQPRPHGVSLQALVGADCLNFQTRAAMTGKTPPPTAETRSITVINCDLITALMTFHSCKEPEPSRTPAVRVLSTLLKIRTPTLFLTLHQLDFHRHFFNSKNSTTKDMAYRANRYHKKDKTATIQLKCAFLANMIIRKF